MLDMRSTHQRRLSKYSLTSRGSVAGDCAAGATGAGLGSQPTLQVDSFIRESERLERAEAGCAHLSYH